MSRRGGNTDLRKFDQDGDGDFDIYDVLLLVVGLGLAIGLWYASMTWSVDGFEIAASDRSWIGWMLGFTITYLQIIFNRGSQNETLWWFGLASYGYGFTTNVVGIIGSRSTALIAPDNYLDSAFNVFVVVFLAAIVEWVPEHLVVRLLRNGKKESDFASEFRRGVKRFDPRQSSKRQGGGNQSRNNANHKKQNNSNQNSIRQMPQPQRDGRNVSLSDFPDLRR